MCECAYVYIVRLNEFVVCMVEIVHSANNAVAKMQDTNVKKREFQSSSAKAATDSVSPVMKVVLSAAQKGRVY